MSPNFKNQRLFKLLNIYSKYEIYYIYNCINNNLKSYNLGNIDYDLQQVWPLNICWGQNFWRDIYKSCLYAKQKWLSLGQTKMFQVTHDKV